MASPPPTGPSKDKMAERGTGLGKYVKRMSSVFKREKSSRSITPLAPAAASTPQTEQQQPTKEEAAKERRAVASTSPVVAPPPASPSKAMMDRHAMQQERARALFAKYGLTLESHEWISTPAPRPTVERVEKSIRMRVHRTCHRCGTIYGSEKVCAQCEHKRCKKCPRYPKKKTSEEKQAERDNADKPKKRRMLTIKTKSGDELAYQPPRQRIRRTCHKCETVFVPPTATVCEQCQHVRCTQCPREPAKLGKWPTGYPGDAEADSETEVEKQLEKFRRTWRKPRQRVRWQCEQCHATFINGSPQCPGCGHERCDKCTRSPVHKTKKAEQFDPQMVAAVEAKLRALGVNEEDSGPDDMRP